MAELAKLEPVEDNRQREHDYLDEIPPDAEPGKELLVSYSGLSAGERDKAWRIFHFPCIGRFRFLSLVASRNEAYAEVLSQLRSDPQCTLLDMACCFAQELRKLVSDGVPPKQLYGADLSADFINLGYELFRDADSFDATFYTGDAFAKPRPAEEDQLGKLDGKINHIIASSFLHLFGWDDQIALCKRMIKFLKPTGPAVIFGGQVATTKPGNYGTKLDGEEHKYKIIRFIHDAQTFKEMWALVGEQTGTKWDVKVKVMDAPYRWTKNTSSTDAKRMAFSVHRISS